MTRSRSQESVGGEQEHEEQVILNEGYEDVVHSFVDDSVPTMLKTPQFPRWRPDKIVMQRIPEGLTRPVWRCTSVEILGAESRPFYE